VDFTFNATTSIESPTHDYYAVVMTVNQPAAATSYVPVIGQLFGPNGPSYLDVEQGTGNDCWLMASLAEVAARDPSDIQLMFTYDGQGVENGFVVSLYTVRFFSPAGVPEYVTVDTELPSGGGTYDHPTPSGVLWAALAEKAYAQANGAGIVVSQNRGTNSYAALNDGYASWALQAITGKPASDHGLMPGDLAAAWNAGDFIVLDSGNGLLPSSDIVPTHSYAVVGYNALSNEPFEVYNPWGTNSLGWALVTYNNHAVYGLFNANEAFLLANFPNFSLATGAAAGASISQNFASQFIGSGTTNVYNLANAIDHAFMSRQDGNFPSGPMASDYLGAGTQEDMHLVETLHSNGHPHTPGGSAEELYDADMLAALCG
jgi:hypothetical protein